MAVVLGLAIADMATSLHKLLRNRRRVRWDWVAPLAALVILTEIFNLWWSWRRFTGDSMADVAPYFAVLVLLFLTASATLPDDVPEEGIDLGRYFEERYGPWVRLSPTSWIVWVLPFAGLFLGLGIVLLVVLRWSRRAHPAADEAAVSPADRERVRAELEGLND